jgi:hypothetical protein
MRKIILLFLPLILFISCGSTFEITQERTNSLKMERGKNILVTTAHNGFYEDIEYKNSGEKTTNAVRNKLRPYAKTIDIAPTALFKFIDKQILLDYDYVIVPEIFLWEDRATNMNFKPDKLILGLTVYDSTGNILNYIEVKGESTKVEMSTNDPIDLVNKALTIYIRNLFILE